MTTKMYVLIAGLVLALGPRPDRPQAITVIEVPGAMQTRCNGTSPTGAIVGASAVAGMHGFPFDGGVFTSIDVAGAVSTSAFGVAAYGDIVGFYTLTSGGP